jgi:hypothetical protein
MRGHILAFAVSFGFGVRQVTCQPVSDGFKVKRPPTLRVTNLKEGNADNLFILPQLRVKPLQPPLELLTIAPSAPPISFRVSRSVNPSLGQDKRDVGYVWVLVSQELVKQPVSQRIPPFNAQIGRVFQRVGVITPSPAKLLCCP